MNLTNWLIVLGVLTLSTWLAAGLLAVFETHQEIHRYKVTHHLRYLTSGVTVSGVLSATAMLTLMALT